MAQLLSGKIVRDSIKAGLQARRAAFLHSPTLAIIQVGERLDSSSYITQKKKFAEDVGAIIIHKQFDESVGKEKLIETIASMNADRGIHGIIVQLPLPAGLSAPDIIEAIDPSKDVDGLSSANAGRFFLCNGGFMPATARGIVSLLKYYEISIEKKDITIIGKSNLVGKPTALSLMNLGATVTVCHKHTKDLPAHTKKADIIVVAAGSAMLIGREHVSPGQIIIDVGINKHVDPTKHSIIGDVDFAAVEPIVAAITPVPGGVGPLTVASLFENLFDAAQI